MNCADCAHPATVLDGDVPLCGTCFYARSVTPASPGAGDDDASRHAMWRRLAEAIAALETIASRMSAKIGKTPDE